MRAIHQQNGFALLIFIVVLLGISGVIGSNLIQSKAKTVYIEKIDHDQAVLRKAKQALLSYAVNYKTKDDLAKMGRLPCPDYKSSPGEGKQDGNCGATHANNAGYLPWKTLGIEALRDSSGECLWYAVSGDYKDSPYAGMLNEDSNGLLNIQDEKTQLYHGSSPKDRPIAVIIAPGPKLSGQGRAPDPVMKQCRGNYTESNYLEGGTINYTSTHLNNDDEIWTYLYPSGANGLENNDFNDRLVWITRSEYWAAVKAQKDLEADDMEALTQTLAKCIADYAENGNNENHWLPWPAAIDMAEYRKDGLYDDQNNPSNLMGRLPNDISNSRDNEKLNDGGVGTEITLFSNIIDCPNLSADDKKLWQNWKDHFFYVVSEGFEMVDGDNNIDFKQRCDSNKCVEIADGTADKVAGIVFYAGSVEDGESRNADPIDTDEKDDIANYLSSDITTPNAWNAHLYPNAGTYPGDFEKYYQNKGDITYCIEVDSTSFFVTDCNP